MGEELRGEGSGKREWREITVLTSRCSNTLQMSQ